MAYTNGIYRIDLVNGSDAARPQLTNCIASNPSGTITRINKTAHGLVTGAIVNATGFSAWLNGLWKITKVDNDNFDLDTAVWQTTADANGNINPIGGSSWSDALLTVNNLAQSNNLNASDTVRVAKTGEPTSIGNATWTSKSATVTLATAQTTNIYLDGAWTGANSGTSTTTTTRKEGTNATTLTTAATTATSTKYAYLTVGGASGLDLSSYDAITFWFRPSVTVVANNYQIKLCSDTTGDTAVDTFNIPATNSNTVWIPLTLKRNGGGALGSAIKSIAWYTGTVSPGNSRQNILDNIMACDFDGLNLTSLISKSSVAYTPITSSETWHGLQSINDTTVILANINSLNADASTFLMGYYTTGTTPETVTTYIRPTFKPAIIASGAYISTTRNGTAGNLINFSGGWNTTNDTQDGDTWIDGQNGLNTMFQGFNINFWSMDRINAVRWANGLNNGSSTASNGCDIKIIAVCCTTGATMYFSNSNFQILAINCQTGLASQLGSPEAYNIYSSSIITKNCSSTSTAACNTWVIDNYYSYNTSSTQFSVANPNVIFINNFVSDYNTNGIISNSTGQIRIENATITDARTAGVSNYAFNIFINKLTASGNVGLGNGSLTVLNMNSSTSQLIGSDYAGNTVSRASQPATFYSNINNVQTDNRAFWKWGNALSQTTTRHTASGVAWQINITDTLQTTTFPCLYPIAKVACNANSLVSVKAWVKLSHATDIGAKLLIQKDEIAGVSADVTATKSADTNWEELTITFTPTVAGVAQIYLQGYWLANLADESIYVDDITVTQA